MNWIIAFTTPIFLAHSSSGVYFLFGSTALLTVVVCTFWMPETRGRTLEDIDASFHAKRKLGNLELRSEGLMVDELSQGNETGKNGVRNGVYTV